MQCLIESLGLDSLSRLGENGGLMVVVLEMQWYQKHRVWPLREHQTDSRRENRRREQSAPSYSFSLIPSNCQCRLCFWRLPASSSLVLGGNRKSKKRKKRKQKLRALNLVSANSPAVAHITLYSLQHRDHTLQESAECVLQQQQTIVSPNDGTLCYGDGDDIDACCC